jgi:hypothetical protein
MQGGSSVVIADALKDVGTGGGWESLVVGLVILAGLALAVYFDK